MDKRLEQTVATLEGVLKQQIALHGELLTFMSHKRDALASAQAQRLAETLQLENQKVQAIGELEKRRLEIMATLTILVQPEATEPMRLDALVMHLPDPVANRVIAIRAQLRQRIEEVRQQTTIARRATESLMRHVQGLIQSIGSVSTGVSTYAHGGRLNPTATAVSTFNLTA